jgi:hypothetical protein
MTRRTWLAGTIVMVTIAMGLMLLAAPGIQAQNQPGLQGLWANTGTTLRITVNKGEVEARFVDVGQGAATLGFKAGELGLKASQRGDLLFGEQTIRYGTTQACYKDGRKVPVIGRMTPDGQFLAFHNYDILITPDCKDTGRYQVIETVWQKVNR